MAKLDDKQQAEVIAKALSGQSINSLAGEYSVSRATIREYVNPVKKQLSPAKRADLEDDLGDFIHSGLRALVAIAEQAADPAWLKTQSADGLHLLYGVLADKQIRVLGALERGRDDRDADPAAD